MTPVVCILKGLTFNFDSADVPDDVGLGLGVLNPAGQFNVLPVLDIINQLINSIINSLIENP